MLGIKGFAMAEGWMEKQLLGEGLPPSQNGFMSFGFHSWCMSVPRFRAPSSAARCSRDAPSLV